MKRAMFILVALSFACDEGRIFNSSGEPSHPVGPHLDPIVIDPPPTTIVDELGPVEAEAYLQTLVQPLVGRVLSIEELDAIEARGGKAIAEIIGAWTTEPAFAEAARRLIQQKLSVSGARDGIDFELPGHLTAAIVREDLPWSKILTSDRCRDASGAEIDCDSGAPYTAGVLTTRAFLASRASRFNLTRSSTLMRAFACRKYPIDEALQPRLEKTMLIPMFRAATPEEQTDERARNGFGNGFGCYTCHGQFSAHAQLFVKFDQTGTWREAATGLQDQEGELGRSIDGLMASHLVDPEQAKLERSQMFGRSVANLADAGRVIAAAPVFVECAARNLLEFSLGLDAKSDIDQRLLADVAKLAGDDPSLGAIARATFTHWRVVESTLASVRGGTP